MAFWSHDMLLREPPLVKRDLFHHALRASLGGGSCLICGGWFALQGDELYGVGRVFVEGGFVGGGMGRNVQMAWHCPLAGAPQREVEVTQSNLFRRTLHPSE